VSLHALQINEELKDFLDAEFKRSGCATFNNFIVSILIDYESRARRETSSKKVQLADLARITSEYEQCFLSFPRRSSPQPKKRGYLNYIKWRKGNLEVSFKKILESIAEYSEHCERTEILNSQLVMQISTFFGRDERISDYLVTQ